MILLILTLIESKGKWFTNIGERFEGEWIDGQ